MSRKRQRAGQRKSAERTSHVPGRISQPVLVMCELCDWAVKSDHWRPAKKLLRIHQAAVHNGPHLRVVL